MKRFNNEGRHYFQKMIIAPSLDGLLHVSALSEPPDEYISRVCPSPFTPPLYLFLLSGGRRSGNLLGFKSNETFGSTPAFLSLMVGVSDFYQWFSI